MSFNRELLEKIFKDDFANDFFAEYNRQIRYSVSGIYSAFVDIVNFCIAESTFENREKIEKIVNDNINQCYRIMKMPEIYSKLEMVCTGQLSEDVIDINKVLNEFAEKSSKFLAGVCEIKRIHGERAANMLAEEILVFLLLMYVRFAVMSGASKIEISHTADEKYIVIFADITAAANCGTEYIDGMNCISEKFTLKYAHDIISAAAEKINGEVSIDEKGMKLKLERKEVKDIIMRSAQYKYGNKSFTEYHNLLSDIGLPKAKL